MAGPETMELAADGETGGGRPPGAKVEVEFVLTHIFYGCTARTVLASTPRLQIVYRFLANLCQGGCCG